MRFLRVLKVSAWIALIAIALVTLVPIDLRPTSPLPVSGERAAAFLLLGLLFGLGYPRQRALVLASVVAAAFGFETLQHLIPTRHGQLGDAEVKAAAGLIGVLLAVPTRRVASKVM